jgi:hypothetical protein
MQAPEKKRPILTLASKGMLKKLGAGNVIGMAAAAAVRRPTPGRSEYLMTPEEFKEFKDACTEIPIAVAGDPHLAKRRAQQRAREFWKKMGERYGFDPTSSEPVPGKHFGYFTAVPVMRPEAPVEDATIKRETFGPPDTTPEPMQSQADTDQPKPLQAE